MKSDLKREKLRIAHKDSFSEVDKRVLFHRQFPGCPINEVVSRPKDKSVPTTCVEVPCAENVNCFSSFFPGIFAEDVTEVGRYNRREKENTENKRLVAEFLGDNPSLMLRDEAIPYVGLQNMGSTCYVNALLQALHADPQFCSVILNWKPEDASEQARAYSPIMTLWKRLFVDLSTSAWKHVSPKDFIASLHVPTNVQQDPGELMTSMLQLLDRSLESDVSESQIDQRAWFRQISNGKLCYTTVCPACGAQSHSEDTFTQLKVPLDTGDGVQLETLLGQMHQPEVLPDRECDTCKTRKDTKRNCSVSVGPLMLAVELLRFRFDQKTLRTRKISSNVEIPMKIDLAACGCAHESARDMQYRLSAVVCHVGSDVNNGHYIAYVVRYEDDTGDKYSFWRFDDTTVTKCETKDEDGNLLRPFTSKWYDTIQVSAAMVRAQKLMNESGLDCETAMRIVADDSLLRRETAYIVFYQHESFPIQTSLPESLQEFATQNRVVAQRMADDFGHQGDLAREEVARRRMNIARLRTIIEAPVDAEHFNYISKDWLEEFCALRSLLPLKPIDNSTIMCPHGGVACGRSASRKMRRISQEAWNALAGECLGGPVLTEESECPECMRAWKLKVLEKQRQQEGKVLLSYGFNVLGEKVSYWVGRDFEEYWKKLKAVPDSIPDPTVGATCMHGNLCIEEKKRCRVSPQLWNWITTHCTKVAHVFPSDTTEPCKQCLETEKTSLEQSEESQRLMKQLQEEMKHWPRPNCDLLSVPVDEYTVVPREWHLACEKYISGSTGQLPGPVNFQMWNCDHKKSILVINDIKVLFSTSKPTISLVPFRSWELLVGMFGCRGIPIKFTVVEKRDAFLKGRTSIVTLEPESCPKCRAITPIHFAENKVSIHQADAPLLTWKTTKDITVSSSTTIETVRLFAYQLFGVEPEWQKLTCNGQTLLDNCRTLADYAVHAGDTITLTQSQRANQFSVFAQTEGEDDDDDVEALLAPAGAAGFTGTAFEGTSLSSQNKQSQTQ